MALIMASLSSFTRPYSASVTKSSSMNGRIDTWRFGAIVGGVVALLILVIVLVIGITLLRKYLHNKQRKRRHYSQHVENGKVTSLSRVTFGVLWSLRQPSGKGQPSSKGDNSHRSSSQSNVTSDDTKPHAFAVASEPDSSCDLHVSREDTIRVTPDVGEPPELTIACEGITESEEPVYYELENPTEVELLQIPSTLGEDLTKLRHHSSNSYTSISSDVQKLPPPPMVCPPHRRGRRHSLPNKLLPVVTQNSTLQCVASDNPNYVNCTYGRRNSDPLVSMLPPRATFTPGTASPAEYEKPMSSYMSLDLSSVAHHSYTPLHISGDPKTAPEAFALPRQQLSVRTRLPANCLRMNSIPEEKNYDKLNPLAKPSLITQDVQ